MITKLLGTLFLSILFALSAALAYSGYLDNKGTEYADQALGRALLAFGIARGLNGVISVAQGTEVAVQPAGIGVNFTPGQILDPVNDLIERFSWIMLAASASLGVQKTLLLIASWPYFNHVLSAVFAAFALLVWAPLWRSQAGRFLLRFALIFVFMRFAVPLMAISSEWVFDEFLQPQYQEATAELEATAQNIGRINQAAQEAITGQEDPSLLDKAKRFYQSAASTFDIDGRIEQYKAAATETSQYAINLVVVFVFQTIVFPMLFLWLLWQLSKSLLRLGRPPH
ncbi:MAG: hypothetical protein KDK04_21320 [Candidatus Competibacteraceae bacterium]|nr:hypothetical protein [Candidatus Competibacteraceae bacterium]MCB1814237.1 hypothetical protein [Candidatus Competibacteraceae bacterium]